MRRIGLWALLLTCVGFGCAPAGMEDSTPRDPGIVEGDASIAGDRCGNDGDCPSGSFCSAGSVCVATGGCAVDADCGVGQRCSAAATCEIGSECGTETFATEAIPPNFLIALDRSCSMKREVAAGVTKWQAAIESLVELTTRYDGQARWGLTLFPDLGGGNCGQGDIPIPVGDDNEMAIQTLLTDALRRSDPYHSEAGPCVTNIDTAMEQCAEEPALADAMRASYVLLVTDGKQSGSCRDGSDARTFTAIEGLAARGVRTFVVGFGDGVDTGALSEFARLGETDRMVDPAYFQADDAGALLTAFDEIVAGIVSCDYSVPDMPADLANVTVFFDETRVVDRDETRISGWDYDPVAGRLTFYGSPCEELRTGAASDVDVVFGCAGSIVE